jgi:hypothetical protein
MNKRKRKFEGKIFGIFILLDTGWYPLDKIKGARDSI